MESLRIKSFGPIADANVRFGDLTLLVGPQASGKSIFIQLLKLLIDKYHIRKTLEQYNYIWGNDPSNILNLYFGEGMSQIWADDTSIQFDNNHVTKKFLLPKKGRAEGSLKENAIESLFYIPAQRILSVPEGRPKTFTEFDLTAPYVLKQFSETLRQMLQSGIAKSESVFPVSKRLKEPLRKSFNESIFHDGKVVMDERTGQKKLRMEVDGMSVPFMSWSAGQKEFMPLLLGFYWLCPPSRVDKKDDFKYVVIEEPEMGLHPQAIKSVILQVIDLLSRDYKVIISTHSPVFLEFAWAFNNLKKSNVKDDAILELFDMRKDPANKKLYAGIISKKVISTFYFDRVDDKVYSKDISTLDAGSDDESVAEWGGLSSFAARATDVVSKYFVD